MKTDNRANNNDRLQEICTQLGELNNNIAKHIAEHNKPTCFNTIQWTFIFATSANIKVDKAEYQRYIIFDKAIKDVLRELGIHTKNNGYVYIMDAVKILMDMHTIDIKLNKDVYPAIAYKYNLSRYSTVEHNIRNAITSAFRDYGRDPDCNKMGTFKSQPSNKKFLFYLTETVFTILIESREFEETLI